MPFRTCSCSSCRGRGEVLFSFLISCRRLAAVARHPDVVASRRATEWRPAGPCPLATQEPYGHRQQREGFPFPPRKKHPARFPWRGAGQAHKFFTYRSNSSIVLPGGVFMEEKAGKGTAGVGSGACFSMILAPTPFVGKRARVCAPRGVPCFFSFRRHGLVPPRGTGPFLLPGGLPS